MTTTLIKEKEEKWGPRGIPLALQTQTCQKNNSVVNLKTVVQEKFILPSTIN